MRLWSLLLVIFVSFQLPLGHSAINKSSYLNIKRSLKYKNKNLLSLKKKLKRLNSDLQKMSNSYMKGMKDQEKISNQVQIQKQNLEKIEKQLEESIEENKKMAFSYSFHQKRADKTVRKNILLGHLIKNALSSNLKKTNEILTLVRGQRKYLNKLNLVMEQRSQKQKALDEKINFLDKKKELLAHKFKKSKSTRDKIYYKLKRLKRKKKTPLQIAKLTIKPEFFHRLKPPVSSWNSYHFDNKGLTFLTENRSVVYAPNKGKVVYSGNLGAYGYLLIIKHDKDVHTLVLGEIQPTIKEDDVVQAGDKVGVIVSSKNECKVYFEIRKNDRTISTEKWVKLTSFIGKGESV